LTMGAGGTASGFVRIAGKTVRFQVAFDQYGRAVLQIPFNGQLCTLTLNLTMGATGPRLEGMLYCENWLLDLDGARASQVANPGRYVFLISDDSPYIHADAPPVLGSGALTITRDGSARVTGSLLLGGSIAQGTKVLEDGSIILNLATVSKKGLLAGKIIPEDLEESDWSGTLRWLKRANPTALRYPDEINSTVKFSGTRYKKTASPLVVGSNRVVSFIAFAYDFADLLIVHGTLDESGLILSESDYRFDMATINLETGMVRGYFYHPATDDVVTFVGIVNRKLNEIQGGFMGPTHGGDVVILPGRAVQTDTP
jgi:hypothetical protein